MMKRFLKNVLPRPLEQRIKRTVLYGMQDLLDGLTGRRREDLIPPKRMIFIGGPEYKKIGDEFLGHFRELCGLAPNAAVLDVGCGIGRMARPLTAYLSPAGRYEGFDIDAAGIEWCRRNITPKFPNFNFQRADIYNKHYHPKGKFPPSQFRFPYAGNAFDFVFLTSVFTHMFPADIDHYLQEAARVLKPGGRMLATFFLWDDESETLVKAKRSVLDFRFEMKGFWTTDMKVPEDAICLREDRVRDLHRKHGLEVSEIRFGNWCGREKFLSFQDIVTAEKKA